ncbi:hypothetical protein COO60DRAFT_435974 [Scenedesmus sp. NREL 46B-D3]|nr:hypothetical protein COO60DRAFT_435974 [Scenedesmus sp. NREL 46B-D3]
MHATQPLPYLLPLLQLAVLHSLLQAAALQALLLLSPAQPALFLPAARHQQLTLCAVQPLQALLGDAGATRWQQPLCCWHCRLLPAIAEVELYAAAAQSHGQGWGCEVAAIAARRFRRRGSDHQATSPLLSDAKAT